MVVIASAYAWCRPGSLDTTRSSSRGTPQVRTASPTAPSFS